MTNRLFIRRLGRCKIATADPENVEFSHLSPAERCFMTTAQSRLSKRRYHVQAYHFVFSAMRFVQQQLGRSRSSELTGHISGKELLNGVRELGVQHFGMLAIPVFHHWGIRSTDDIGRIVFEMIERGEMKKTDKDQLADFSAVYDFDKVFREEYTLDTSNTFS